MRLVLISLAPFVGTFLYIEIQGNNPPSFSIFKIESNQDVAALAQQVQALAASMEELTKQNQEMKLRL